MKFTDADKIELVKAIAPAIVAMKPMKAPPARDGSQKAVSIDFGTAIWIRRYVETIVKVLEDGDQQSSAKGDESKPF